MWRKLRKLGSLLGALVLFGSVLGAVTVIGQLVLPEVAGADAASTAISWAQGYLDQDYDSGLCLQFVTSAYEAAGINIGSVGEANGAAQYWSTNPEGYTEFPGDTSPPVGALVFWNADDVDGYSNPYGHVGIYVGSVPGYGSDEVISTSSWGEPATDPEVHYFSLSGRNAAGYPYLGWMAPPGVTTGVPTNPGGSGSQDQLLYQDPGSTTFYLMGNIGTSNVSNSTVVTNWQQPAWEVGMNGSGSGSATPSGSGSATGSGSGSGSSGSGSGSGSSGSSGSGSTPTPAPTPTPPSTEAGHGYWLVGSDGGIFSFGAAQFYGSTGTLTLQRPVVGITPTSNDGGYWLVGADGGIFSFGNAGFYGSIPGLGIAPAGSSSPKRLNAPIVGMVPSADGGGYFMVASDGGVFAFGDAKFEGSCPGIGGCSGAAVAVMPDASGNGYWLVTATGHVYAFGDAVNYGAPGPQAVPVAAGVRTKDGGGYWLLFANGAVAPYGDASNLGGPVGALGASDSAAAIFTTSDGAGYWVASADGSVYTYGDAPNDGSMAGQHLNGSIIAGTGW